jgi:hypothetical protein
LMFHLHLHCLCKSLNELMLYHQNLYPCTIWLCRHLNFLLTLKSLFVTGGIRHWIHWIQWWSSCVHKRSPHSPCRCTAVTQASSDEWQWQ